MNYKVVLEIEVEADTPLEAAKTVQSWQQTDTFQYYTQDPTGHIHSVDLTEPDEDAVLETSAYTPLINS